MLDSNQNQNQPPHDHPFLFSNNSVESDTSYYGTWQPMNYASRPQKTAQNHEKFRGAWNSMGPRNNGEEDSGVCSPPLWKTTGRAANNNNNSNNNNYRSLSPASRAQAIARGQRELMEMVKNMPESCYELSLKDLVEHHHRQSTGENEEEDQDGEDGDDLSTEILMRRANSDSNRSGDRGKNFKKKKLVTTRSGSVNNGGFLLKMVLPISLGSGKKSKIEENKSKAKKVAVGANSIRDASAKVSPKPQGVDAPGKAGVDSNNSNEWWKVKRLSNSASGGRSESGVFSSVNSGSMKSSGSSSTSSCSSRSSSRRKTTGGCWSFISCQRTRDRIDE